MKMKPPTTYIKRIDDMGNLDKHSDTNGSAPTAAALNLISEVSAHHSKWFNERIKQLQTGFGMDGVNLFNQHHLMQLVDGSLQDITYLMQLCTELINHIQELERRLPAVGDKAKK